MVKHLELVHYIKNKKMYVVIEKFGFPELEFLRDEEGNIIYFDDISEAMGNANAECQDGIVVNIKV